MDRLSFSGLFARLEDVQTLASIPHGMRERGSRTRGDDARSTRTRRAAPKSILVCSSWPGESCVSEVFWRDGLNQTTCKGRTQHASSSQYDAQAAQHAYVIVHPLLARRHTRWNVAIAARTRRATTLASAHRPRALHAHAHRRAIGRGRPRTKRRPKRVRRGRLRQPTSAGTRRPSKRFAAVSAALGRAEPLRRRSRASRHHWSPGHQTAHESHTEEASNASCWAGNHWPLPLLLQPLLPLPSPLLLLPSAADATTAEICAKRKTVHTSAADGQDRDRKFDPRLISTWRRRAHLAS